MKTELLALFLASLVISGCSSSPDSKAPSPTKNIDLASIDQSLNAKRIRDITSIAKNEQYEVIQAGESVRIIIPVHSNFHPKRNLLLPSGLNSLGKLAKAMSGDDRLNIKVISNGSHADTGLIRSTERAKSIVAVLRLAGVRWKQIESVERLFDSPMKAHTDFELIVYHDSGSRNHYAKQYANK